MSQNFHQSELLTLQHMKLRNSSFSYHFIPFIPINLSPDVKHHFLLFPSTLFIPVTLVSVLFQECSQGRVFANASAAWKAHLSAVCMTDYFTSFKYLLQVILLIRSFVYCNLLSPFILHTPNSHYYVTFFFSFKKHKF